ncbi:MAG: Conserved helix repeat-containing protein [Frankiales bacterium]|jgi:hypothetical protein|nr:Conserved helix repeat-containing protein [Frankiales bacterium]
MAVQASVDYQKSITDGLSSVATFVPKLLGFLVILVIGYVIAKLVAKVVDRVLERAGFDKAVERGGIKKALDKSSFDASDIVSKIVFFAIFIPVLSAAVGVLGIAALQQPLADFIALLPKIAVAVVLVVLGAAIAGAAKKLVEGALGGLSYGALLANAASVFILLGFVKAALDEVGIATQVTTPLLYMLLATVAGILIVGVGGGLISPMRGRLEDALNKASDEAQNVKQTARANKAKAEASVYPTEAPASQPVSSTRR